MRKGIPNTRCCDLANDCWVLQQGSPDAASPGGNSSVQRASRFYECRTSQAFSLGSTRRGDRFGFQGGSGSFWGFCGLAEAAEASRPAAAGTAMGVRRCCRWLTQTPGVYNWAGERLGWDGHKRQGLCSARASGSVA